MATTYLSRTLGTPTNNKKWTFSAWVKKAHIGGDINTLFSAGGDSSNYFQIWTNYNNGQIQYYSQLSGGSAGGSMRLSNRLRDISGWYNIVVSFDSANYTASERLKIYINGNQELDTSSGGDLTYPTQNTSSLINSAIEHTIGKDSYRNAAYLEGSVSHLHFIDGTVYDASAFGSTDSVTGEWQINTGPNVTYGNNGFFILKDGNTITDSSPNSNNWSLGGGTLTDTKDCPSNVFATLNPLIINNFTLPNMTYVATTEGNNTLTGTGSSNNGNCYATLGASSGKFYCEVKITVNQTNYPYLGIMPEEGLSPTSSSIYGLVGYQFSDTVSYEPNGNKRINGSTSSYGDTYGLNDIIGIAMDLDNGAVYFSKNGTFQNSGNPASGASKTGAALTFTANNKNYFFGGSTFNAGQIKFNFGNGYFGTTAVSSAGTAGSTPGTFEYDVPSGYEPLSTKGLNA